MLGGGTLVVLLGLGMLGYVLVKWRRMRRYWGARGVASTTPKPFFGDTRPLDPFPFHYFAYLYDTFPDKDVVGFFEFNQQKLLIRDPELIIKVMVKDFTSFMDRGVEIAEETSGLLTLIGLKWRAVRASLTPTFSSGKLKTMLQEMLDCGRNLAASMVAVNPSAVDTRELMFSFTTDVIATTAYGLPATSLTDPDSQFRKTAVKAFNVSLARFLGVVILGKVPFIGGKFKVGLVPWDVAKYFSNIARKTLEDRKKSGRTRNDFVQLLLDLKEKGVMEWTGPGKEGVSYHLGVTDKLITSQAFTFLLAGSEPVANTLLYTLLELAREPDMQDEVRAEINAGMEAHGGLNREALGNMPLIDMCIKETLRLYPVTPHLVRIVTKEVELRPGLVLEPGTGIVLPMKALQTDPRYYPEPHSFRPRRFLKQPPRGTYFPFGEGPRKCIGMRYAMQEMKVALAVILHRYKVYPKTEKIEYKKWSFLTSPNHAVYLNYVDQHPLDCTHCMEYNDISEIS